jgi:hypothetical protein
MKKIIVPMYYMLIVSVALFIMVVLRWNHYKKSPELYTEREEIVLSIDSVQHPKPNTKYYYYRDHIYQKRAGAFPFIEDKQISCTRNPIGNYLHSYTRH